MAGGHESHGHSGGGGGKSPLEFFSEMIDHEVATPLVNTIKSGVESGAEFAGGKKGGKKGGGGHHH
ncbi:MAG: hypothetical protein M1400_00455 [Patescibacteria group bacterium]|nr:hypothetical protein [Patescibacteria group bacterium]